MGGSGSDGVPHTLVTMSRGDAHRIGEWVDWHAGIGFTHVHVVLDDPVDDSEDVLRGMRGVEVTVEVREPVGEYYDGLTPAERWQRVVAWKARHAEMIRDSGMPINDVVAWRQYLHMPAVLERYRASGPGWLSWLDCDELLVLHRWTSVQELTHGSTHDRLRFLSYNFDTAAHDPSRSYRQQHVRRWSRESLEAYGKGWDRRVKSLVRYSAATPLVSMHAISAGRHHVVPWQDAKVHHYRDPAQDLMPYDVEDTSAVH